MMPAFRVSGGRSINEDPSMKISARNQLKGKIVSIKPGVTTTHVRIDLGGQIVTAAITAEAAEELGLKPGMEVSAIVKASDVIIGVDG
jgi:molybdopterin-binding protein